MNDFNVFLLLAHVYEPQKKKEKRIHLNNVHIRRDRALGACLNVGVLVACVCAIMRVVFE